ILAGLDVLATTKARLRTSAHGQVLVEMAVVRLSRLDELVPVSQLAHWLSQPGSAPPAANRPANPAVSAGLAAGDGSKKNGMTGPGEPVRAGSNGVAAPPGAAPTITPIDNGNLSLVWDKVKVGTGPMHAGQLSMAPPPAIVGPRSLVLRFPARYNHAYEYCREPGRAQLVEGLLKKQTGQDWALRFELDAAPAQPDLGPPPISNRERERRALETPLLSRIVSHLGGRLLKMDEGFGEGPAEAVDESEKPG
ncbi:MAG: hypothetical protein J2P46_22725, partial [Zavarzinella sp.]|nr:hypothetical protein [Zavarzinella sp.]